MFTPPPSPQPPSLESVHCTNPPMLSLSPSPSSPSSPRSLHSVPTLSQPPLKSDSRRRPAETSTLAVQDRKRQIAWRTGLTVIILPLFLALVTLVMRVSSRRPAFLDSLAGPSEPTHLNFAIGDVRAGHLAPALHRRQTSSATMQSDKPSSTSSAAGVDFPSQTSSSSPPPSASVPTIPSLPPVLPTPFPQPFETTLSLNFTTNSCTTFFLNMTQSLPFRQCRAFSFLSQTSTSFLQAQSNVTALNIDIWGTCNTPLNADQCAANMGWFKSELLSACSEEKSQNNQIILQSFASLESYTLMRQVACLSNQNTYSYCYVEAASNHNPSDLYFYSLPYGFPIPNDTNLSCSTCTKSVMALFGSQVNKTTGLEKTYNAAAILASSKCGSDYVYTHSAIATSSALPWVGDNPSFRRAVVFILCAFFIGQV